MKHAVAILAALAALAAWPHDAPATATTTPSGCTAPSTGDLEFALDAATHTVEAAARGTTSQFLQRLHLRFALPQWVPQWDCVDCEVEVVLPSCVRRHAPVVSNDYAALGDALRVTGLGATDNAAHWTIQVDHAQNHHDEIVSYDECHSYAGGPHDAPTDLQRGWFVLRVKERGNTAYVTLPGLNSTRRLYPFTVGVRL